MHILYIHQYFVPPGGSGGTRSYEMARRLVNSGHKVSLITSSAFFPQHHSFNQWVTRVDIEGIQLHVIQIPYSNRLTYFARMWAFVKFAIHSTLEIFKVKNVNIVFATSTPLTIALPGIAAKLHFKCPMVFEVRDLWPELPVAIGALKNPFIIRIAQMLERLAYKNSDHIIALSPGMKEGVIKAGFIGNKITVIPNSCDTSLFRVPLELGIEFLSKHPYLMNGPIILYAGTFGIINGVSYLVEIAAAMKEINSKVCFLIVGDGKEKPSILEKALKLGVLDNNFWMIPSISKTDMPKLLAATTVATSLFVDLPEMWNNSANKFFDALAAGKPLLINYGGWHADILRNTGAGIVVPPDDPKEAARLLNEFLSDPKLLSNAQLAANKLADTEFNRDELYYKLLHVFQSQIK